MGLKSLGINKKTVEGSTELKPEIPSLERASNGLKFVWNGPKCKRKHSLKCIQNCLKCIQNDLEYF